MRMLNTMYDVYLILNSDFKLQFCLCSTLLLAGRATAAVALFLHNMHALPPIRVLNWVGAKISNNGPSLKSLKLFDCARHYKICF